MDSEVVAWWGAVVATFVLAWDIVKWFNQRPKIRINSKMPVVYFDSKRIEVETDDGDVVEELVGYCHVDITNLGSVPTTLVSVCCSSKPTRKRGEHSSHNVEVLHSATLPYALGAGQLWSCRIPESSVSNIASQYPQAHIKVSLSHRKRPIYAKIQKN